MTWPRHYDPILCGCRIHCGDVAETDDDPDATCKELPSAPRQPDVEVALVHRDARPASPSSLLPEEGTDAA
jgi:hypothetical protein